MLSSHCGPSCFIFCRNILRISTKFQFKVDMLQNRSKTCNIASDCLKCPNRIPPPVTWYISNFFHPITDLSIFIRSSTSGSSQQQECVIHHPSEQPASIEEERRKKLQSELFHLDDGREIQLPGNFIFTVAFSTYSTGGGRRMKNDFN